jgi:type II secretory pathway pseudopilin PulG
MGEAPTVRVRRGITLFEAVVALTIVGLTAAGAMAAAGGELRTAERARRAVEVEALATQRLDFLALLNDRELQLLPDSVARGTFPAPLDQYEWTTSAAPVTAEAGVYDVRVKVSWDDGSYTLRTYLFRRPPLATGRGR